MFVVGMFAARLVMSMPTEPARRYGMPIITLAAPLVNGDLWDPLDAGASCEDVVALICGDDLRPPPTSLVIKITTETGKLVELRIPNSGGKASVRIDGKSV